MKKLFAVLLIAVVVMASAFAFEFKSLGIETGGGNACNEILLSGDMEVADNFDTYIRLGYNLGKFNVSVGGQYKVAELKMDSTKFDVKPGVQLGFNFIDGFIFTVFGTCDFSFKTGHFSAFLRPGLGMAVFGKQTSFAFEVETGVAYLF